MANEDAEKEVESMEEMIKRNQEAVGNMNKSVELLKEQLTKPDHKAKSMPPTNKGNIVSEETAGLKAAEAVKPHLPIVKPVEASQEVQAVYEEFHRRMSFPAPPNFITTQGHSYVAARGTWEVVRNVLVLGEIPRWMKETIFVAISNDRDCRYCTAAHIACCRMLGVDAVVLNQVVSDVKSVADKKLREMIRFTLKCSRNPQSLDDYDYTCLRQAGLKQSEIMELIAMAALSVYANIIADATGMEQDEMFATL